MSNNKSRTRNWTIIIYEDSAPSNWRQIIENEHIEWIESPLHDKDLNATGELKKPHIHVLLMFGSVKSYDQVLDFIQPLNCPIPQQCHNTKGLIRYMTHMDNPEKTQYLKSDIIVHGGMDLEDFFKPTSSERYQLIREMGNFIKENGIIEYQDFFDYASANRFDDWFPLLCDNSSFVIGQYIKSVRHRKTWKMDFETGEILKESKD